MTDKFNGRHGRTADEIKKGLWCCCDDNEDAHCKSCPYDCGLYDSDCIPSLEADALSYIELLEANSADQKRFELLRAKTFEGIKKALAIDSHCKSYEGAFEVLHLYTDYFEDAQAIAKPEVVIRLHCYVLGPARHYEWKGRTFEEALAKAEYDISDWIRALEVK